MSSPTLLLNTPAETAKELGQRIKALRLSKDWKRDTLATRAGVTPSSLRRFENTGLASLELVLRVAHALSRTSEVENLFQPSPASSIEELEAKSKKARRRRGLN